MHDSYIILIANAQEDKIAFMAGVSANLHDKFQAGNIIKRVASLTGGSGGGRKDVAQGGGKDVSILDAALATIKGEL